MWIVGETVDAVRQLLRQAPREKQVLGVVRAIEPEQDAAKPALPRQREILTGFGFETRRIGKSAGARVKPFAHVRIIRRGDEPDRNRGRRAVCSED
jgi:hypothetical protein